MTLIPPGLQVCSSSRNQAVVCSSVHEIVATSGVDWRSERSKRSIVTSREEITGAVDERAELPQF